MKWLEQLEFDNQRFSELRSDQLYQVIRHRSQAGLEEKFYEISGTHVYVAELNASSAFYLRLGTRRNPWVRIRAGDLYMRNFRFVSIKTATVNVAGLPPSPNVDRTNLNEVILYVSDGPFLTRAPISHGIGRGFFTANGTTLANPGIDTLSNNLGMSLITFGKSGGTMLIRNTAAAGGVNLLLAYGNPLSPPPISQFYVIPPQAEERLDLDSQVNAVPEAEDILLASSGAAGTYSVLAYPFERDVTIPAVSASQSFALSP